MWIFLSHVWLVLVCPVLAGSCVWDLPIVAVQVALDLCFQFQLLEVTDVPDTQLLAATYTPPL